MPALRNMSDAEVLDLNLKVSTKLLNQAFDQAVGDDPLRPVYEVIKAMMQALNDPEVQEAMAGPILDNLRRLDSRIPDGVMSPKEFFLFAGELGKAGIKHVIAADPAWLERLEVDAFDLMNEEFSLPKRAAMKFADWSDKRTKAFLAAWRASVPAASAEMLKPVLENARQKMPKLEELGDTPKEREEAIALISEAMAQGLVEHKAEVVAKVKESVEESRAKIARSDEATGFEPDEANMPQAGRGFGR